MVTYGGTLDEVTQETLRSKDALVSKYHDFFRFTRLAACARTG